RVGVASHASPRPQDSITGAAVSPGFFPPRAGALHGSEAICPGACQSQESWGTPYCQTEPRRGALWAGERWLTPWQACAPDPEGTPVAARIGASRPSTFISHARPDPKARFWPRGGCPLVPGPSPAFPVCALDILLL